MLCVMPLQQNILSGHMTFIQHHLTSMQRHDLASTLRQYCIDVMCLLGRVWDMWCKNVPVGGLFLI